MLGRTRNRAQNVILIVHCNIGIELYELMLKAEVEMLPFFIDR